MYHTTFGESLFNDEEGMKKTYKEQVQENYTRITSSPEFKRRSYVRTIAFLFLLLFGTISIIITHFAEEILGRSTAYSVGMGAVIISVALSILIGERLAHKKYGDD